MWIGLEYANFVEKLVDKFSGLSPQEEEFRVTEIGTRSGHES
jgi:hypothetical protein